MPGSWFPIVGSHVALREGIYRERWVWDFPASAGVIGDEFRKFDSRAGGSGSGGDVIRERDWAERAGDIATRFEREGGDDVVRHAGAVQRDGRTADSGAIRSDYGVRAGWRVERGACDSERADQ